MRTSDLSYHETKYFDQPLEDQYRIPGSLTSHRNPGGK